MPFHKHAELFLPDPVFVCRMRDEFDFEGREDLDSRLFFYHEQVEPPFILFWVEVLTQHGFDETYLLNQDSVEQCWRAWGNAYGLLDWRVRPKTSKRVLQRLGAIDFSLFAYASREDALADLALNYPANQLLWEVGQAGTSPLAGLAWSVLAGDLLALGPLADALEERGDPRAATVRKWSESPGPETT